MGGRAFAPRQMGIIVTEQDPSDDETADANDAPSVQVPKGRRSFLRMRRELTEEELATPAVQKLLMDELERLEAENAISKDYESKFHEKDKMAAVLEGKLNRNLSTDVFFGSALSIGAVLIGYSSSIWLIQPAGLVILILGVVLMAGGIAARVILK